MPNQANDYTPHNPPIESYNWRPRGIPIGKQPILEGLSFQEAARDFRDDPAGLWSWFKMLTKASLEVMGELEQSREEGKRLNSAIDRSGHYEAAVIVAVARLRYFVTGGSSCNEDKRPECIPSFDPPAVTKHALEQMQAALDRKDHPGVLKCARMLVAIDEAGGVK